MDSTKEDDCANLPCCNPVVYLQIVPYSANLVKRGEGASGEMNDFFLPKQNSLRWPPWSLVPSRILGRYITCGIVQME